MNEKALLDYNEILSIPGNQVTVREFLNAVKSDRHIVPFVGEELPQSLGVPSWRKFLWQQAQLLELYASQHKAEKEVEADILSAAGQFFLNDKIEEVFGKQKFSTPLPGAIRFVPYITKDLVITTNLDQALEQAFQQSPQHFSRTFWGEPGLADFLTHRQFSADEIPMLWKLRGDAYQHQDRSFDLHFSQGSVREALEMILETRTILFLGVNFEQHSILPFLAEGAASGATNYALMSDDKSTGQMIRRLYASRIRPIWYPTDSDVVDGFLFYLAEELGNPPPTDLLPGSAPTPSETITVSIPINEPPDLQTPELPHDLIAACRAGECAAFLGSGVSARAGLPTWKKLVEGIVTEAERLELMNAKTAAQQHAALAEGEINAVADNAISAFRDRQDALIEYYRRAFTTSDPVPEAFHWLSKIPFTGVLTSNYDSLLEKAYEGRGYEGPLTPKDAEHLLTLLSLRTTPFLLKLYGDLARPETVVQAPVDYLNLVRSNAAFAQFMEGMFFSRTLLFLGVSLDGLSDYLEAFRFPSGGVPRQHYALVAVAGSSWQVKADVLKRRYNITVLPFQISEDFPELDDFLKQLAERTSSSHRLAPSRVEATSGPQVRKIILQNIGPFRALEINFTHNWKILLGNNGVGKSTILKGLATAIIGSEARHYAGRLLRAGESLGSVTVITSRNPSGYVAHIQKVGTGADVITRSGRMLETEGWVALGFPPLRTASWKPTDGPQSVGAKHPVAGDLLPLISGDVDTRMDDLKQWLVNMESLSRKEGAAATDRQRAKDILEKFFDIVGQLTEGMSVRLKEITTDYRVMVETPDGVIPIEALSQGMTSLLGWVGIFLQRLYEVNAGKPGVTDPTQEYALVLMDELDAHMHPAWQLSLVAGLKTIFPNVQFIVSTHSPLIVGGLNTEEVIRFDRDTKAGGQIEVVPVDPDMMLGRADQILTGDLFGLDSTLKLGDELEREVSEYEELLAKDVRTKEEEKRYVQLFQKLQSQLPAAGAENKLERRSQDLVHTILAADYRAENVESLKNALLEKARQVGESMGWKELQ